MKDETEKKDMPMKAGKTNGKPGSAARRKTPAVKQPAPTFKGLVGNPEWEAVKGNCRNIGHDDAVQESFFLQKQFRQLWSDRMARSPVDLNQILRTLTQKKIPFVLTGAHAIGGWTGRPRDTYDVDILVKGGRNHGRAVNAIKALYPELEVRRVHGVTAFFVPGEKESVIDVTYPHRADNAETLANPVWVENKEQGLRYRIPSLEAALANKYGAMLSLSRDPGKRGLDAVDFSFMVKHSTEEGRQPIDVAKLQTLGELVWPGGGGAEILLMVDKVKQDGFIDMNMLFRKRT